MSGLRFDSFTGTNSLGESIWGSAVTSSWSRLRQFRGGNRDRGRLGDGGLESDFVQQELHLSLVARRFAVPRVEGVPDAEAVPCAEADFHADKVLRAEGLRPA